MTGCYPCRPNPNIDISFNVTLTRKDTRMKNLATLVRLALAVMCTTVLCLAQPSEEQIKKDVGSKDVIQFRFSKSSGTKQWNKDLGNWEYVRGVEIVRPSGIAGVNLLVVGDAVYQWQTGNKYTYWKFRVLDNKYDGLPEPSADEVMKLVSSNWELFYGYLYGQTINIIEEPHLANPPQWSWDSPKNLDLSIKATLEMVWQGSNIAQVEQVFRVRMFRDDVKGPWLRFMVTSRDDQKVLSQKAYSYDQIRDMQKRSLQFTMAERQAAAAAKNLPTVDVKEFSSAADLARFVHDVLRNGNADRLRAVMLKLLSPRFFENGSKTVLTPFAEQSLREWTQKAYQSSVSYHDAYCQNYEAQNLNTEKVVYIPSCLQRMATSIGVDRFNMGYVEGVATTALRITNMDIGLRSDDDAKAFLSSFSDRKKLCPKD